MQKHYNQSWRINETTTQEKISTPARHNPEQRANAPQKRPTNIEVDVLERLRESKDHNSAEDLLLELKDAFHA